MVEKIIVSPESIRGLGNIVSPKTGADFSVSDCVLTVSTDTVDGETVTVFGLQPESTVLSVSLTVDDNSVMIGDTIVLSATVLDEMTAPVEGASVSFKLSGSVVGTSTTNSSGVATLSYVCNSAGSLSFTASCMGNDSSSVSVTVTGHDYSLTFSSTSYTTDMSGDVTVSAVLTDNGAYVSGATVTFTGGTSTVTATTDSNGVASASVNFTSDGTLTATYSNVSDTCTVTVLTYLFYDECTSADGLSQYGSSVLIRGTNAVATISYDSTNNCYALTGTGNYHAGIPIPALDDKDNYTLEADLKCTYNDWRNKIGFCFNNPQDSTVYKLFYNIDDYNTGRTTAAYFIPSQDKGSLFVDKPLGYNPLNNWVHMKLEISGTTVTCTLSKTSDGTQLYTSTNTTVSYAHRQILIGIYCELGTTTKTKVLIKNIKAEAL